MRAFVADLFPYEPAPSQTDWICFSCHSSCRRCSGFSKYNCTTCPFPDGLKEVTITTTTVDGFSGQEFSSSWTAKECTPGPKLDIVTVGIVMSVPGGVMFLILLATNSGIDALVLVSIAFADLVTDVLYVTTEDFASRALFWASFCCVAVIPIIPFALTLKGDPGMIMALPRVLEAAQKASLGDDCGDIESACGCDPFDIMFDFLDGLWDATTEPEVQLMPLGVLAAFVSEDEIPFSPAWIMSSLEDGYKSFCDDADDCVEYAMIGLVILTFLPPFIAVSLGICIPIIFILLALQVVYTLVFMSFALLTIILMFIFVMAALLAYRVLFILPIGMGMLRGLEFEWWNARTESFPWFQPFEEMDSLGKGLVTMILQPPYWALSLVIAIMFVVLWAVAVVLTIAMGMLLYSTRVLAVRSVQAIWIKVWTLDPDAELDDDGVIEPGKKNAHGQKSKRNVLSSGGDQSALASGLLLTSFKQMMVGELVLESLPQLALQAINN